MATMARSFPGIELMNVINCPCCRRQLRVHQEMARQRVKCRYCGAIFAGTTSLHDEQPQMEEPAFVPRETIVNISTPAVAEEVEMLPPDKIAPSARGRMAAISALPEQLPLTENPAIGKRNEFELDQLIPETPPVAKAPLAAEASPPAEASLAAEASPAAEALPAAEVNTPSAEADASATEKKIQIGLMAAILGGAIVLLAICLTWWIQK